MKNRRIIIVLYWDFPYNKFLLSISGDLKMLPPITKNRPDRVIKGLNMLDIPKTKKHPTIPFARSLEQDTSPVSPHHPNAHTIRMRGIIG